MRFLVLTALALSACGGSTTVLSVNTSSNTARANGTDAITLTATVKNSAGDVQPGATVTFDAAAPGKLSETSVVTDAKGEAVTKLTAEAAGTVVVTVATAGAPNEVKPSFTFTTPPGPGTPAALRFSASPSTTTIPNLLRPTPTVVIVTDTGAATTSTARVLVKITPGSCTATLKASSLVDVAARMGEASFAGLEPVTTGTGCTLTAESAGLAPAVSTAFDVQ